MTISRIKTIEVKTEEKLNIDKIWVGRRNIRDADSVNIDVHYDNEKIGYGHFNNRTNFAHITINDNLLNEKDECDLIDYLVDGIENRTIELT